ncbi:potassium/sodium eff [Byssothecium circinans]|uniref:P-type Na(+) transporter n=1 Tax=Byssothecium circinans TaxID=147558 RepID=A0A6A5TTU8_9PLEO|nr:potassium/sodium eff [Byssothecium circinans]
MGESEVPTVEETSPQDTEPPIRPYHGPTSTHQPQNQQPSSHDNGSAAPFSAWHTLTASQVAARLDVDVHNGLHPNDAASRLLHHGPNKVKGAEGLSLWAILLRQVSNSLTLVLVITMGLSFGINDYIEGGVITAVILLNIIVGFWQDYKAEKTIESLKKLTAPDSTVVRGGETLKIKAVDLVPGDVVRLETGNIIPADLRLVDGMNISTNEAFLTGESEPVEKTPSLIFDDLDLATGDRTNLAFSGSEMTRGRGSGIVIATGMNTEVGQIATMLRQQDSGLKNQSSSRRFFSKFLNTGKSILGLKGTPLQISLSKFALLLFALAILLAIIVFSANKFQNIGGEVLIYGICVAVAVIPESLIAVLTITIAVGAKAMAKANVIIRVSSAIEAVGGVTNICSDKTGTLTQGRMIGRKAIIPGFGTLTVEGADSPFDPTSGYLILNGTRLDPDDYVGNAQSNIFFRTIALCNQSKIEQAPGPSSSDKVSNSKKQKVIDERIVEDGDDGTDTSTLQSTNITRPTTASSQNRGGFGPRQTFGEPTEIALHILAMRLNMGKEELLAKLDIQLAAEFPFDSSVKKMTVVYEDKHAGHLDVYTKGAAETMYPALCLTDTEKTEIDEQATSIANEGFRVLCVAHKILPLGTDLHRREAVEKDLKFVGLVAIYDPPRVQSKGAVQECQIAGITVHMLTGDHPGTAEAIAREVGILDASLPRAETRKAVMVARNFDAMSEDEIDKMVQLPLVVARCSPATKVKMVEALHRRKRFCVMTGDGVNDSPALKKADVGIAMGTGSDVAKDAAKMVLTDDNFASIVKAVEEGRRLFNNIQKFLMHLLISNIAQVILLLIGLAFKDTENHSVFPLSPIEILWVNLITSSFLAIGLGLEEAQPDTMFRPPHSLQTGVFTKELITDKFIYGFFMGSLCLMSFALVAYVGPDPRGLGLGHGCNDGWNDSCAVVFRARATTYATITLLLLVTAWEVKHFSRSLFNLYPESHTPRGLSVFPTVWRNRFLFWAVTAGFSILFAIVYLPVINRSVFKHGAITWEWGISFGCVAIYIAAVESWKAVKRRFGIWSGKHKVLSREDAESRVGMTHAHEKSKK